MLGKGRADETKRRREIRYKIDPRRIRGELMDNKAVIRQILIVLDICISNLEKIANDLEREVMNDEAYKVDLSKKLIK